MAEMVKSWDKVNVGLRISRENGSYRCGVNCGNFVTAKELRAHIVDRHRMLAGSLPPLGQEDDQLRRGSKIAPYEDIKLKEGAAIVIVNRLKRYEKLVGPQAQVSTVPQDKQKRFEVLIRLIENAGCAESAEVICKYRETGEDKICGQIFDSEGDKSEHWMIAHVFKETLDVKNEKVRYEEVEAVCLKDEGLAAGWEALKIIEALERATEDISPSTLVNRKICKKNIPSPERFI